MNDSNAIMQVLFFWGDSWGWSSIVVAKYVFFSSHLGPFSRQNQAMHIVLNFDIYFELRERKIRKDPKTSRYHVLLHLQIRPFLQWWPCTRNGCGKAVANLSGTLGTSTFSSWHGLIHGNGGFGGNEKVAFRICSL